MAVDRTSRTHTEQSSEVNPVADGADPEPAKDNGVRRRLKQFTLYRSKLVKLLEARGSREDAEDLAHEAMIRVGTSSTTITGDPWPYLRTTALNLSRTHHQRVARRARLATHAELRPGPTTFEEDVINRRLAVGIIESLRGVEPEITVRMVCAKLFCDLTFEQVGGLFGVSESAAQSRIQRALVRARNRMPAV